MKIRAMDIALAALVVLAVAGGVWGVLRLDAGMDAASGVTGAAASSAPVAESRADLKTAIPEAIRLLEAKDYAGFFREFAPPEEAKMIDSQQFAQMVQGDAQAAQRVGQMLLVLRSLRTKQPQMDSAGTLATYAIDPPINYDGRTTMIFIKENGLWYLKD